jgi:putative membrane protein
MWHVHDGMGWWMVFGWIWFIIFWGAIVSLVVWGMRRFSERGNSQGRRNPLDIAKERYARGEISKEEFEQIKKDLT